MIKSKINRKISYEITLGGSDPALRSAWLCSWSPFPGDRKVCPTVGSEVPSTLITRTGYNHAEESSALHSIPIVLCLNESSETKNSNHE